MLRKTWTGLLAGAAIALAAGPAAAQELTIFWAEWDPANYLQELVNEYTAETGVTVTVRDDAVARLPDQGVHRVQRQGRRLRHGRRRLAVARRRLDRRPLRRPDRLLREAQGRRADGSGDRRVLCRVPEGQQKYWAIPLEGDATGWAYRKDWFEDPKEMEAFKAKYGYDLAVPKTYKELRDIAEFFYRPDEKRYGIAIYTDNSYDALIMGIESAIFSYGGELGDYATYKVDGIVNSPQNVEALEMYRDLYKFTPPNWGKTFFMEDNQAITENLAAMSMNFFAFFPALANQATNPNADDHRLLRQSGRPGRQAARGARRAGHLDRLLLEEPGRGVQVPRVVHQGRDARRSGPSSAATPATQRC